MLGAYIISMAAQPSDVLAVMYLQSEARHLFSDSNSGAAQRVVPLFETEQDLNHGHETMQTLWNYLGTDLWLTSVTKIV